jgi:hypothetical protein
VGPILKTSACCCCCTNNNDDDDDDDDDDNIDLTLSIFLIGAPIVHSLKCLLGFSSW